MKRLPFWKTGQTTVKGILKKMPFLCRFSHKETFAPLILIPFSLVLKTQFPKQEQRIMYIISVQRTLCHCEAPLCGAVAISRKGHLVIPRKILL
jgi:hypothetical protein